MTRQLTACVLAACLGAAACGGSGSDAASDEASPATGAAELGPFGPNLGVVADVVRSATLTTSGAVTTTITGTSADDDTGLRGQCNPSMWANFGIDLPPGHYYRVQVTLTSKDAIPTGATGEFPLDRLDVEFTTEDIDSLQFVGPGTLTLTTHDATPGQRHMVGTMSGTGLEGRQEAEGQTLDATLAFDMDFSCGVAG